MSSDQTISAGVHGLVLDEQGQVYAFGRNEFGRLGLGDETNRLSPEFIPNLPLIKGLSAGKFHSLLLDEQGQVYSFGYYYYGELGLGDQTNRSRPELITEFQDLELMPLIKSISAGEYHNLLLDEQGRVYAFGQNGSGELGLGDRNNRSIATLIPRFQNLELLPRIKSLSAGGRHSLLLDDQGRVYGFGWNELGQLGWGRADRLIPTIIPDLPVIKSISAGENHSLVLSEQGAVYAFGWNNRG
jgi:alpha-tubulin suppressor-like RCC1 family protein